MKYLIVTDHKKNDLRVSKSQRYLPGSKTLQIPGWLARFNFVPGYCHLVYLLTLFYKTDVIYSHDLFLSYACCWRNKSTYADLHEDFYSCYENNKYRVKFIKWFYRPERIWRMADTIRKLSIVIAPTEILVKKYGASLFYPNVGTPSPEIPEKTETPFPVIVYIGRIRRIIHLHRIKSSYTIHFISDHRTPQAKKILLKATIGLINGWKNDNSRLSLPNKLFTYMNYGICVVCPEWMEETAKIIKRYDCGYVVKSVNTELAAILQDKEEVKRKGKNGRLAAETEYNEDTLVKPFFERLHRISNP